jgi:hypothetical protein
VDASHKKQNASTHPAVFAHALVPLTQRLEVLHRERRLVVKQLDGQPLLPRGLDLDVGMALFTTFFCKSKHITSNFARSCNQPI